MESTLTATFEETLRWVEQEYLPGHFPLTSGYPAIAVGLAKEIAYHEWRRIRAYDHLEIVPGATSNKRDGIIDTVTLRWHTMPNGDLGDRTNGVTITKQEAIELRDELNSVFPDLLHKKAPPGGGGTGGAFWLLGFSSRHMGSMARYPIACKLPRTPHLGSPDLHCRT